MLRLVFRLSLAAALAVVGQPLLAWGRTGHAIVADIAEAKLTPQSRQAIRALLADDHASRLSDIASWADAAKGQPDSPSHTIRLSLYGPVKPAACHTGFCVTAGVDHYVKVLADRTLPIHDREVALKYVVHLVGDVHQPLHCVPLRYSRTPVIFMGQQRTLHWVWDDGIIQEHGQAAFGNPRDAKGMAAELVRTSRWTPSSGDVMSWALESRNVARTDIFNDVPPAGTTPVTLPDDYASRHWPAVAERLTQAGYRLAQLLNQALD